MTKLAVELDEVGDTAALTLCLERERTGSFQLSAIPGPADHPGIAALVIEFFAAEDADPFRGRTHLADAGRDVRPV